MMGQRSGGHRQLFYSFNLDDHVPSDNLLRGIDRFLDLGELRRHLAPFYNHTGRPSVDPELMVRMREQALRFGADIQTVRVSKVDFSSRPFGIWVGDPDTAEPTHRAEAVIVSTGAQSLMPKRGRAANR